MNSFSYLFSVQARDSGPQPLTATAVVRCSVLDVNDNPPEFMHSSFHVSLPENLPPGIVHTVQASDPDLRENGTIDYSIQGKKFFFFSFMLVLNFMLKQCASYLLGTAVKV